MAGLLNSLMWNGLEASVLALVLVGVARFYRLSAPARHLLWLIVLLKLLAPPVALHSFGLSGWRARAAEQVTEYATKYQADPSPNTEPSLPQSDSIAAPVEPQPNLESDLAITTISNEEIAESGTSLGMFAVSAITELSEATPSQTDASEPVSTTALPALSEVLNGAASGAKPTLAFLWLASSPGRLLFWAWLAGAICAVAVRVRQSVSVLRMLRKAGPAPEQIVKDCNSLARQLGLMHLPLVRVVSHSVSPTVCVLGTATIVLPVKLVERSCRTVVRSVLAHELAHLKRRDHWVCWLELVAGCVYWWLPTFWWSCRAMRRAADEAADAWAVSIIGCRQKYAESLLETVEYLVADRIAAPAWGLALGERDTLARRLTMIMKEPLKHRLSWPAWLGIAAIGLIVLPAAPQRLSAQDAKSRPDSPTTVPSEEEFTSALESLEPQRPAGRVEPPRDGRVPQTPPGAPGARGGPVAPFMRDGRDRPDPDRRLEELEGKIERVLKMLEGMQGAGGNRGLGGAPGRPGAAGGAGGSGGSGGYPGQPGGQAPAMRGMGPGTGMGGGAFSRGLRSGGGGPAFGGRGEPGAGPMQGPYGGPEATQSPRGRDGRGSDVLGQSLRDLNLSAEQRERLEQMHRETRAEVEKFEAEQAKVMAEFQRRRGELEHRLGEMINSVLTPEQRERRQSPRPPGEQSRPSAEPRRPSDNARPREAAEPRRGPDQSRPREAAEPRRGPEGERPRDGGVRRPDGERPREGGDRPREGDRRPDGERPRDGGDRPRDGDRRPGADRPIEEGAAVLEAFDLFVVLVR